MLLPTHHCWCYSLVNSCSDNMLARCFSTGLQHFQHTKVALLQAVPRSNLQLISVACMLVASKHEEERHPSVQDFTSIADNCFLPGDLLKMEALVLQSLGFRINCPTSHTFLSLFHQGVQSSPKCQALAAYLTVSRTA